MAFPADYTLLRKIPIDATAVSGSNDGFAGLITEDVFKLSKTFIFANTDNGGGDVRFSTDEAGTNQIPLDIVSWDTSGETCQLWYLADGVDDVSPTDLYIWGDNTGDSQPAVGAAFGRNAVFQNEDIAHHLIDNATNQVDSAGNDDGTLSEGGATTGITPQIPPTNIDFNETVHVAGITDPTTGDGRMAVRAWFRQDDAGSKGVSGSWLGDTNQSYLLFTGSNDLLFFRLRTGSSTDTVASTTTVQDSNWHHVAGFYDGSNFHALVDGVSEGSASKSGVIATPSTAPFNIARYNESQGTECSDMQEHRVSTSSVITLDYIATEYSNQNDPSSFYLEPEEVSSGTNWNAIIKDALDNNNVVLSVGNTVATITLPAFASYDTDVTETITWTIPAASLTTSATPIVATPTHTITPVSTGITAAITETGPAFTDSINTNLSANITGDITEQGPSFTESINVTLSALTIQADITETGPSFTEAINVTLTPTLTINASISEQGPSFTESIGANLDVNISAAITELGPSFTESINVSSTIDIRANITESGPSFVESILATIPIKITVNPKNTVRVKRKSNTVTIKRKSNIIRVR